MTPARSRTRLPTLFFLGMVVVSVLSLTSLLSLFVVPRLETLMLASTANAQELHPAAPGELDKERIGSREGTAHLTRQQLEERLAMMEKTLAAIKNTSEMAESRSYTNKMMGAELIASVRVVVAVLIVIAVGFPLSLWLLSRRRLIGLSTLSSEIAATLVVVEERQAKLANILKELQDEMDFMHGASTPNLKDLIAQAEKYLKQNAQDLTNAGLSAEDQSNKGS